ncbi:MAG: hypothetical protein JSW00_07835 [Thermoplasmata archaeon]|nr:MAG: hypothetical protein JSW00_07835 [Thermoplasmata archaeon]
MVEKVKIARKDTHKKMKVVWFLSSLNRLSSTNFKNKNKEIILKRIAENASKPFLGCRWSKKSNIVIRRDEELIFRIN